MWVKFLLLLAYLLALFIVSRLLEAAAWYESGFLPYRILDPFSLSVRKLKRILETRGMSYAGLVEKQELTSLVQSSGDVTEGELVESLEDEERTDVSPTRLTQFTGASHFYEEVEDTKDSIWLVQVISHSGTPLLSDVIWKKLQRRVAPFGVRTGIFDCTIDHRLCKHKGWKSSQLILAMPKGQRAKDNVILHSYPVKSPVVRLEPVIHWIRNQLMTRVHQIQSLSELKSDWLEYEPDQKKSEVRVLFFSVLLDPPLFLLALGVKFSGRIKVGMIQIKENSKDKNKQLIQDELIVTNKIPAYLIVTPERIFTYGQRIGEYLTYRRMELFLKTLRPEVNDIFVLSLILVNLIVSLDLLFIHDNCTLLRHLIICFWRLGKFNFLLFLTWLLLLALAAFPLMESVSELGLKVIRVLSGSDTAAVIRDQWQQWRFLQLNLCILFFVFSWLVISIWKKIRPQDVSVVNPNTPSSTSISEWWSVSLDSYLMDCFFRPIASLAQPITPSDLDLEEGMDLLIERLAVPNLWLHSAIPTDYIKNLPLWNYRSMNVVSSEEETDASWESDVRSSEDEGERRIMKSDVPVGMIAVNECAICLDVYRNNAVLCGLPCGHNYHQQCILVWLSRDNHHCPICRWPSYKVKGRSKVPDD